MAVKKHVLPVIILCQFCCTSLWFAGNGIMDDLITNFNLEQVALGHLTSAVQMGFICGTLIFAFLNIVDRFSPSKVFMVCALLGAAFNLGMILPFNNWLSLTGFRFFTGFMLAGIYPVGMKIAADYFDKGLGKSLGFLVGALVLGTSLPHLISSFEGEIPWKWVLYATSILAIIGGLVLYLTIPDGPYRSKAGKVDFRAFLSIFKNKGVRSAALGYFGHMWELYALWAFIPVVLVHYNALHSSISINISFWSFLMIGIGGIGCSLGGLVAEKFGAKNVARTALLLSGICCLVSPLLFHFPPVIFYFVILIWGVVVTADSPLFSTLVAQNADPQIKGTALTLVNCIGFAITILSIQILNVISVKNNIQYMLMILSIGPILGVISLYKKPKVI